WKSVPVYDTPDIIYLAAWSPLIIAGAPVYSVDGRLAGSAWRRLGPRADIWDLRRYVLRRGTLVTVVVCGITLLVGSLLGGAVRDADRVVVPGPGESPRNELPGSPLPQEPGATPKKRTPSAPAAPTRGATAGTGSPAAGTTTPRGPRRHAQPDPGRRRAAPAAAVDAGGAGAAPQLRPPLGRRQPRRRGHAERRLRRRRRRIVLRPARPRGRPARVARGGAGTAE